MTAREAGRALRAVIAPLERDFWPYVIAPVFITLMLVGFDDAIPPSMAFHLLRDISVYVLCIGLPVHLTYVHLGERLGVTGRLSARTLPLHVLIVAGGSIAGSEVATLILSPLHETEIPGEGGMPTRAAIWTMALLGNGFVTSLMFAFAGYRDRIQEIEMRELRAHRESLAAQVQALQARIQPHFLFNCLNTVAGLIQEDPVRAEAAVEKLSDLFRYTLDASRHAYVPLADELAAVEGYLELETLRYGDRLKVALHVDPETGDAPVPPLVLQPIVENAVRHAIAPRREGGRIDVHVERVVHGIRLRVEDDGPGPGASTHRGSGTALADLRQRLSLLYGSDASIETGRAPIGGFRVSLTLPLGDDARFRPDIPA